MECVLGSCWRPKQDVLVYISTVPDKPLTRRGLLGTASSIYDPLGLVGPVTIEARALFQESCRQKLDWDDDLHGQLLMSWNTWKEGLAAVGSLEFARCFLPEGLSLADQLRFELHHFCDASIRAYGAAGFIRVLKSTKAVGVSLIMSKGKLAPLRTPPVPRLELTAAQSAVQLDIVCKRALDVKIVETYFWTDSTIVLWYISNPEIRCMTFVQNKVNFILDHTQPEQWRHVPTDLNPADILSRGASPQELASSRLWSHGPAFLMLEEAQWPARQVKLEVKREQLELKEETVVLGCELPDFDPPTSDVSEIQVSVFGAAVGAAECYAGKAGVPSDQLLGHSSSWYKLRKFVVVFSRCFKWWLAMYGKATPAPKKAKYLEQARIPLQVEDMDKAEWGICHYLQSRFRDVHGRTTKQYRSLFLYVTDGLIRVGGRLARAEIHPDQKNPIVLPPGPVAEAIVQNIHARLGHAGPQRVLTEVLQKYWILQGKAFISRILDRCIPCKKLKARFMEPEMSDLHKLRVTGEDMPFYHTGVNYFGPMIVKERRVEKKRYGCLFTCMQTRAIHIELAWSLDMDSCIKAVFRFAARRGMPRKMKSDNGTNFVSARAELQKEVKKWNKQKMTDLFRERGCDWSFNTPAASHMGGVWERMIRSVRTVMMSVTVEQVVSEESLLTLLAIIEDILNNRPITPVSTDVRDLAALTPNHFLRMNTAVKIPLTIADKEDAYRRRWKQVMFLATLYWNRWRTEYLSLLQERTKWYRKQRNLQVGDLVVVKDDFAPRNTWPLARVERVFPDEFGVVRSAEIYSRKGRFRRPVVKLCLVEASA